MTKPAKKTAKKSAAKRMGRPIRGDEPRSARLVVALTPSERARLEAIAEAEGCTLTDAVVAAITTYRPREDS